MMTPAHLLTTFLGILTLQATAFAQATSETIEENRLTQLATLRSTLTNQLHLQAYELIDEMVYEWKERSALRATYRGGRRIGERSYRLRCRPDDTAGESPLRSYS